MAKKIKLADIAAALNVSVVTVSKALSDQKGVSEEMREKIRKLAREWGYQPPSTTKEGRVRRYYVGIVIPEQYQEKQEYFYWQLYQEVNKNIKRQGSYSYLEILEKGYEREIQMPQFLTEKKVSGIIVIGKLDPMYEIALQGEGVPLVYLESFSPSSNCDGVISNGYYGAYLLTSYLFSMGHEKIRFAGSIENDTRVMDRYLGYVKALMEQGQTKEGQTIIEDRDRTTGRVTENSIQLPEGDMPTAFVCGSDLTAGMLIQVLRQNGYRVPHDISVVGFGHAIYPGLCNMEITTFEMEPEKMATKCVELLMKRMNGEQEKSGVRIVEGRMIYGDTVNQRDAINKRYKDDSINKNMEK